MLLADELGALGFQVELVTKTPGCPNVVATMLGAGEGPVLILNDHLDTYPIRVSAATDMKQEGKR